MLTIHFIAPYPGLSDQASGRMDAMPKFVPIKVSWPGESKYMISPYNGIEARIAKVLPRDGEDPPLALTAFEHDAVLAIGLPDTPEIRMVHLPDIIWWALGHGYLSELRDAAYDLTTGKTRPWNADEAASPPTEAGAA
jgi:hypothetical protein